MQSLYSDIISTVESATFTIPDVDVRKPFDTEDKTYPLVVVHEIVNQPLPQTSDGETRTALVYQFDLHTQDCAYTNGTGEVVVLNAFDAGQLLLHELDALLESTYKMTRKSVLPADSPAADVVTHILRSGCVYDDSGYTYRP